MFLTISSNRQIEALAFKRALKKRLKQPELDKNGRKKSQYDPLASVDRKTTTIRTTRNKTAKKTLNAHLNDLCILLIRICIILIF